jgi:hypothetical protein
MYIGYIVRGILLKFHILIVRNHPFLVKFYSVFFLELFKPFILIATKYYNEFSYYL